VEVQTATGKVTVDAEDIAAREASEMSLMPDGLLEAMSEEQVRDLIAYLMSPKQIPLQ